MAKKILLNLKLKKNASVKVFKTFYIYVSKGPLSIGETKFWGKVVGGGV